MRNDLPTISESADELKEQMEAATRKRMKQRLNALYLIQSGECTTREGVAKALGVHRHTISRWLTKYEEGGISELLEIRTRPNRKRVVPAEIYQKMEGVLRASPEQFSSYRDVQAWLKSEFGLEVKYKTLYRLIRYELKINISSESAQKSEGAAKRDESFARKSLAKDATRSDSFDLHTERKSPTVANFFRSVASLLDDDDLQSTEVLEAVRAATAILNAAPPFGFFGEGGQTYVPVRGRQIQRRRKDARRELRRLQSSINSTGVTAEQTRALLNRIADDFDKVGYADSASVDVSVTVESSNTYDVVDAELASEPDSIFLDDELEVLDAPPLADSLPGPEDVDSTIEEGRISQMTAEYIVLFAEDDDITASIVKRQLGKNSATVLRAESGRRVLELLAEYPVDLMVINTRIRDEDGLKLLRTLRDEPSFDNIPIVAVGWPEDAESESEVLRYGADEYVVKPFSPVEFSATVMRLLVASRAAVQKREDRGPVKIARINPRGSVGRDSNTSTER